MQAEINTDTPHHQHILNKGTTNVNGERAASSINSTKKLDVNKLFSFTPRKKQLKVGQLPKRKRDTLKLPGKIEWIILETGNLAIWLGPQNTGNNSKNCICDLT